MNNQLANDQNSQKVNFDLEERTAIFGEKVIDLVKKIPENSINKRLIEQVVGAAGSLGANYCEATEAESRNDFIHKVGIAKKEARETTYWLKMIVAAEPNLKEEALKIYQEAKELNLIMNAIVIKSSTKIN